eukprot:scpid86899/ scgid13093/ 
MQSLEKIMIRLEQQHCVSKLKFPVTCIRLGKVQASVSQIFSLDLSAGFPVLIDFSANVHCFHFLPHATAGHCAYHMPLKDTVCRNGELWALWHYRYFCHCIMHYMCMYMDMELCTTIMYLCQSMALSCSTWS